MNGVETDLWCRNAFSGGIIGFPLLLADGYIAIRNAICIEERKERLHRPLSPLPEGKLIVKHDISIATALQNSICFVDASLYITGMVITSYGYNDIKFLLSKRAIQYARP